MGVVVQAYRPPYETITDEVEWLLVKLNDVGATVLVPYAGATHIVDDNGDAVTIDEPHSGRPQAVEQRLGFTAAVIQSAPTHHETDELSMAVRRSAFAHYYPGLPEIQIGEVEPANEALMLTLSNALETLPYATGRRAVPQICVLRNQRGYVGVLRTRAYFKVIDWPFDGPPTQLVVYMGKVGLTVRKGYLPTPDLADADAQERAYVVGTLLLDEILTSRESGHPAFFDLVDPPAMSLLGAVHDCVASRNVVLGSSVRGPAYNCLFLETLTSNAERFAFTQAFLPPPELLPGDITYERNAALLNIATSSVFDDVQEGPTQKFLLLFDAAGDEQLEFGAELSPLGVPDSGTDDLEVRVRFWAPHARTSIGGLATFKLWAGRSLASGVLLAE